MDETAIRALLDHILAPWVRELVADARRLDDDSVTLRLPFSDELRHAGGVICGQVFMAAADTAMIVAISARARRFQADDHGLAEHQLHARGRKPATC